MRRATRPSAGNSFLLAPMPHSPNQHLGVSLACDLEASRQESPSCMWALKKFPRGKTGERERERKRQSKGAREREPAREGKAGKGATDEKEGGKNGERERERGKPARL